MPLQVKAGVQVNGLRAPALEALAVAETVFDRHKLDVFLTSGLEGKHKEGSLHYKGLAVDLRLPLHPHYQLDPSEGARITLEIFNALERALPMYDVIHEPSHYHVEFDPKGKRGAK